MAVYGDVFGFLKSGIEKYWDESKPLEIMRIRNAQTEEVIYDDVNPYVQPVCEKCGTPMISGLCPSCDTATKEEAADAINSAKEMFANG